MLKFILDLFMMLLLFRFILYFVTKIIGFTDKYTMKNYKASTSHNKHHNKHYPKNYPKNNEVKNLIKCNYCEIYIEDEKAIKLNNKNFCCKEHVC